LTDPRFLGVVDARDRLAGRRIGVTHGEAFQLLAPVALQGSNPEQQSGLTHLCRLNHQCQ
jgi:hypothetical protein